MSYPPNKVSHGMGNTIKGSLNSSIKIESMENSIEESKQLPVITQSELLDVLYNPSSQVSSSQCGSMSMSGSHSMQSNSHRDKVEEEEKDVSSGS